MESELVVQVRAGLRVELPGDTTLQRSEYGLIRFRTLVECRWLQMLADLPEVQEVPPFDDATSQLLERFGANFSVEDAQEVKNVSSGSCHVASECSAGEATNVQELCIC